MNAPIQQKNGLTIERHQEIGETLKQIRKYLAVVREEFTAAHDWRVAQPAGHEINKAIKSLEFVASEYEGAMWQTHTHRWQDDCEVYFGPAKGTLK